MSPDDAACTSANLLIADITVWIAKRRNLQIRPLELSVNQPLREQAAGALSVSRRSKTQCQRSWRRHFARHLHALRSRICRLGTENPATHRQPFGTRLSPMP